MEVRHHEASVVGDVARQAREGAIDVGHVAQHQAAEDDVEPADVRGKRVDVAGQPLDAGARDLLL